MKTVGLFLLAVFSAAAAVAQAPTAPVVDPPGANPADVSTVKPRTVRGCLNSANDNYTVTDQVSGKTYKIAGDTARLKQHIGQLVEISGETQTVDGPNPPEESSTGETLTLGDVREVADTCPGGRASSPSTPHSTPVLIAQRPVPADANPDLNSSEPFSSNVADTSSSARTTRTVSTKQQVSRDVEVTGHAGQHQAAVNSSSTGSAGRTTPPANAVSQPGRRDPSRAGNAAEEGDRAAQAASRAEFRTNPQTGKTTFSTMQQTQQEATPPANPKTEKKPGSAPSRTNNEPK